MFATRSAMNGLSIVVASVVPVEPSQDLAIAAKAVAADFQADEKTRRFQRVLESG